MTTQNATAQQRRILNLIWASAGEYGFSPLFMAYGTDKKPDYYMNCMVGFVHKWYGDRMVQDLFSRWEGDVRQDTMDDLAWLALENAAYERELNERPVLKDLRIRHASDFFSQEYLLSRQEWMAKNQLVYTMQSARWKQVLGKRSPVMTPGEKALSDALLCSGSLNAEALTSEILDIMRKYLFFDGHIREKSLFSKYFQTKWLPHLQKAAPRKMVRSDSLKISRSQAGSDQEDLLPVTFARGQIRMLSRENGEKDLQYIECCFGKSLFPLQEQSRIDQALCTDTHFSCHLFFTDGTPGKGENAESRRLRQQAAQQAQRNRQYFIDHRDLHRNMVRRLSEQIKNCILVHQQTEEDLSRRGRLDGSRVWREVLLQDDRVFTLRNEDPRPAFTVDLLLDGSASRLRSQEIIAAQGCILSESLSRNGISVRVSSFCSLRSYTVIRILKDYGERQREEKIFNYFAAGWNRDGLALRGMGKLLETVPGKRHLLILLTDASPSDSHKIPPVSGFPVSREYDGQAGIDDAAREVRALRKQGIRVAAVFMGTNSSVPGARQIFGESMVRIRQMDQLAAAAGKLIQAEIQELSG